MTHMTAQMPLVRTDNLTPKIPAYLSETYNWAYLTPASLMIFDHTPVVSAILWGNFNRLQRAAMREIRPGQTVLQPACVYGRLSPNLATHIGPDGHLDVIDVAPIQAENCRRKLAGYANTRVRVADATDPGGGPYDVVCCFFLLHELPDDYKHRVTDALLNAITPDGKVVFIDYHRPHPLHPLKPITSLVFDTLEPFAKGLWRREISGFASEAERFTWRKERYFGGLFQKVVAQPRQP